MKSKAHVCPSHKRTVRSDTNTRPPSNSDPGGLPVPDRLPDETEDVFGGDKTEIDSHIAKSMAAYLQLLADNFWYDLPARIAKIKSQEHHLVLQIELPFRTPLPSRDPADLIACQKDVGRIKSGFLGFLKEEPLIGRRLANLFYSEFHRFLLGETKRFRLDDAILTKIERLGERRLAGRPKLPIPGRAKEAVKREVTAIYRAVLEIQQKIKRWQKEANNMTEKEILHRLRTEPDRDRYPWSRYVFRTGTLPAKRAYGSYKQHKGHQLTRPGFDDPERWSAPDVAALWTQTWFYRESGERYDLREIKKLLKPAVTS